MSQQISIDSYVDYIRKNFKIVHYPQIGNLYFFTYLFNRNKSFSPSKSKFYDFYPATFIFDINIKNKTFTGLNIHMIPSDERKHWFKVIGSLTNDKPLDAKKFLRLKELMKISQFGVRTYSMLYVKNLREIPNRDWDMLIDKYANTTYQASLAEITAKYLSLI